MAFKSIIFMNRGPDIIERKKVRRLVLLGFSPSSRWSLVTQISFCTPRFFELEVGPIVMALLLSCDHFFAVAAFILMPSRSGLAINRRTRVASSNGGPFIPMKKRNTT